MLAVVVLSACTPVKHAQAPTTPFIATDDQRVVTYFVPKEAPSPTVDIVSILDVVPTPTPIPTPTIAPPQPTSVYAASVDGDVPWYVAKFPDLVPAWRQCLSDPRRHDLSAFVWQGSIQGGYVDGWDYDEALRIFGGEGGNDNCQFNTAGSGACGFGQQLPCFEGALTFDGQFSIIMAKFQDGRRRFPDRSGFWAHWLQFYH